MGYLFLNLCAPANTHLTSEQFQVVESYLQIQPDSFFEEEVAAVIHSLPLKKVVGPDKLSNEHLKFGSTAILTRLFNAILLSSHIPATFRHGYIIPIPKGRNKDLTNPSNYRGITLLSAVSKVFEKVILLRLSDLHAKLNWWFPCGFQLSTLCFCVPRGTS